MDIVFKTNKLLKLCNSLKEAQKKWGTQCGALMLQRLNEMAAANNLKILRQVHTRAKCHPLTGNLKGKWSVDLEHPRRLIFEPVNIPLPTRDDGGLILEQVTAVRILEVRNTHG